MAQLVTPRMRPSSGQFTAWKDARDTARLANKRQGRGHRAVKALDGQSYAVIFRPAVAANKQRRVRSV
jgi:hypothetical protein